MFTQKYQTQQESLTIKYWMDAPGIYIARVTSLGREDAAKQLKKIVGNELGSSIMLMVHCIIRYLPFLICD